MKKLKQDIIKEFFSYSPATGIFVRIKSVSNRCSVGDVASRKNKAGYINIFINGKRYLSHRLAWLYVYGHMPPKYIDHINGIRDDNRICNLRCATITDNARNRSTNKNNTSGHNGVSWCKTTKSWLVTICSDSKMKYVGRFKDKNEAISKREEVNQEYGYHENHGRKQGNAI